MFDKQWDSLGHDLFAYASQKLNRPWLFLNTYHISPEQEYTPSKAELFKYIANWDVTVALEKYEYLFIFGLPYFFLREISFRGQ